MSTRAAVLLLTVAACGSGTKNNVISGGPMGDAATLDAATLDAPVDSLPDSGPPDRVAPRAIAPLSTSRVTRRRPTLRWVLPSGVTDATVDLCLDRACTAPIGTPAHVTGSSYAPEADLPVGVVFWRLHPSTTTSVSSPTWQFTVPARSAPVDSSWGTTLDLNGDGYADVVVGAPTVNNVGAAYVYTGSRTGLATTPATTLLGLGSDYPGFGWSVAGAGDVNGDGFADVAIATRGDGTTCVYVYLGGADALPLTPATTLCPPQTVFSSGDLSASSAGDVNGDGYADLVVAGGGMMAPYVYLGSAHGLDIASPTILAGPYVAGLMGTVVAGAGDVNGDGLGDVVVAAFYNDPSSFMGGNYVYLGRATGIDTAPSTVLAGVALSSGGGGSSFDMNIASAGDVNGDGYADILAGACDKTDCAFVYLGSAAGVAPTPATTITTAGGVGGIGRIASAGDVNGDGYGDVAVATDSNSGPIVSIYLGGASGLATSPAAAPTEPGSMADGFGGAFASAGDVNGDGFADLVVGADFGDPGNPASENGSAYVYLGGATGLATSPKITLQGPESGDFGFSVFGASN